MMRPRRRYDIAPRPVVAACVQIVETRCYESASGERRGLIVVRRERPERSVDAVTQMTDPLVAALCANAKRSGRAL